MAESFFNFKVENPKLARKIVKPLRFCDSADYTTKNTPTTEKEYFENIYTEAFKNVTECLTKRFNQKGLEYYDDLQQYLLLVAKNQPYEEKLKKILEFYNNERSHDFDEVKLRTQLKYFSANFPRKGTLILDDIIEYFQYLEPSSKNLLSEFGKIIELILVFQATNATSKRSFSKLKLLKTYLRSTISQARLNHYMMFSVFKEHVD